MFMFVIILRVVSTNKSLNKANMKKSLLVLFLFSFFSINSQITLDQYQLTGGSGGPASGNYLAQTFVAGNTGKLDKINLFMANSSGGPVGVFVMEGTDYTTATIIDTTSVNLSSTLEWEEVNFSGTADIVSGNTYWIVVYVSGNIISHNYSTSDPYPNGQMYFLYGTYPTWVESGANATKDIRFQVYLYINCINRSIGITADDTVVCQGNNTNVTLSSSESDVLYSLRDIADSTIVGTKKPGVGGSLSFPTGSLTAPKTYFVLGEKTISEGLELDGVDDYGSIGDSMFLQPGGLSSWNFWLNLQDTLNDQAVIGWSDPANVGYEIMYNAATKSVDFIVRLSGGYTDTASAPITGFSWNQITFTIANNDSLRAYVNGVKVDAIFSPPMSNGGFPGVTYIGKDKRTVSSPLSNLKGIVDEFSFWKKQLTPTEITNLAITPLFGGETSLSLYYRFNSNSDQNYVTDLAQYSYDMILFNTDSTTVWVNSPILPPPACENTLFDTVRVEVAQPIIATIDSVKDVLCFGDSTGMIYTSHTGGFGNINYDWNNGDSVQDITGLIAGNYELIISDVSGCVDTIRDTITQPLSLNSTITGTNLLCNNDSTGTASVVVTGGTPGYHYNWSNGDTLSNTTGLHAGKVYLIVTDTNGCQLTDSVTLTEPTVLTSTITGTNLLCNNDSSGTANALISGGTLGYSYNWSNGDTLSNATSLMAGKTYLLVTDTNGCQISDSITLTEPTVLSLAVNGTDLLCNNDSTGTVSSIVNGGTPGYDYLWDSGDTIPNLSGLHAGTYSLQVTDTNGCSIIDSVVVGEPSILTLNLNGLDLLCNNDSTGTIASVVGGGTPGYNYLWSNGDTTSLISGLDSGTYTLQITDTNGCQVIDSTTISQPTSLMLSLTGVDLLCYNDSTGMVNAMVSGGTASYSYSWNNGDTSANISGLAKGKYILAITDSNGCMITDSVSINEPTQISLSSISTAEFIGNDGSIDLTAVGGTLPYLFDWDNDGVGDNDDTEDLASLAGGVYTVIVTDSNGCTKTLVDTVDSYVGIDDQNAGVSMSVYPNPAKEAFTITLNKMVNGTISIYDVEGRAVYTDKINSQLTTISLESFVNGVYYLSINDSKINLRTKIVVQR